MRTSLREVAFLLMFVFALVSSSDAQPRNLTGTWLGTLSVSGMNMRIVFNLTPGKAGELRATLDSPDQGAKGIPVDTVIVEGDSVHLLLSAVMGRYDGAVQRGDSTMTGAWRQSGTTLPLNLRRSSQPFVLRRPQEPKPPFPYDREDVTVENPEASIVLAGTLTKPRSGGPFAAVILITGSGPQDRDESLMGHRPFLVLADHLTRQGIAVLRCDDRGVGKSKGRFPSATTLDFASDVRAQVRYLGGRSDIRHDRIGLIGHSEGGIIAPIVASQSNSVAFIVLMAGTSLTGKEIILMQDSLISLADGASSVAIERSLEMNRTMFEIIRTETDSARARNRIEELVYTSSKAADTLGMPDQSLRRTAWIAAGQLTSPWMRFFLSYDPVPALRTVRCPVLAINGEKDLQVPAAVNLDGIERALNAGKNNDFTVKMLPGLNHLFQSAVTGSPREYSTIEETISPVALQIISDWIVERVK